MNTLSSKVYRRAEKFLGWNTLFLVYNSSTEPNWIHNTNYFWYLRNESTGNSFILVNSNDGTVKLAFNQEKFSESLSKLLKKTVSPFYLPFSFIEFSEDMRTIYFTIDSIKYSCDLETYTIQKLGDALKEDPNELLSPNGLWALFCKDYNLYLRSTKNMEVTQLTFDGEKYYDYGTSPECNTHTITDQRKKKSLKPIALWSHDSTKLITLKINQRTVNSLNLLQTCSTDKNYRPKNYTYKYAFPYDTKIPKGEFVVIDLNRISDPLIKTQPFPTAYWNPIEYNWIWWGEDNKFIYFTHIDKDHKTAYLYELNAETGYLQTLVKEQSNTFVDIRINREDKKRPNVRLLNNTNEIIWWSQRDGWAHLYLYNCEKDEFPFQITSGKWVVREIEFVNEKERIIFFTAGGKEENRDPYYKHLYSVNFNGTRLKLLTPERADHNIMFSPSGEFFVDTYSRIDTVPISVLRRSNGDIVCKLEHADMSGLDNLGWKQPKPFKVFSEDNRTEIFGAIFFPSDFNEDKSYPVLDYIYHGPQRIHTPKSFPCLKKPADYLFFWTAQSFAELGFIVIILDGRGTPHRSKIFHDYCYGDLYHSTGLKDHVSALKQLSSRYSFLDLDRVGIFGHSSGGTASLRALLEHPDFFKVAVSSAGVHDHKVYLSDWAEKYLDIRDGSRTKYLTNVDLAKNLKSKLLIAFGELDDNTHPVTSMRMIEALIKEQKSFDMLILPNENHLFLMNSYFIRRRWDYFVENLLNKIPPHSYKLKGIDPRLIELLLS